MNAPLVPLGEIIKPAPIRRAGDREYPLLSMTMRDGLVAQAEKFKKRVASRETSNYRVVKRGELVVGFPIDEAVLATQKIVQAGIVSPAYAVWSIDETIADGVYLERFLRSPEAISYYKAHLRSTTARRRTLPPDKFRNMPVPLPSLERQRLVTSVLDKAEAIRRKRELALTIADEFINSVFLEMFGDLSSNSCGWPTMSVGRILELDPQNGLYRHSSEYGSGTKILRIDGFYDGYLRKEREMKRLRIDCKTIRTYELLDDDIIINRVNSPEHLGKCALIGGLTEPTVFESNMMRFRVNAKIANPRFIVDQLRSTYLKTQIARAAKPAVNQSSINQKDVKSFEVRLPPVKLQNKYNELVAAKLKADVGLKSACLMATTLFASLSQRAFSGKM